MGNIPLLWMFSPRACLYSLWTLSPSFLSEFLSSVFRHQDQVSKKAEEFLFRKKIKKKEREKASPNFQYWCKKITASNNPLSCTVRLPTAQNKISALLTGSIPMLLDCLSLAIASAQAEPAWPVPAKLFEELLSGPSLVMFWCTTSHLIPLKYNLFKCNGDLASSVWPPFLLLYLPMSCSGCGHSKNWFASVSWMKSIEKDRETSNNSLGKNH